MLLMKKFWENKNLKKVLSFLVLILFTIIVLYFSLKDHYQEIVKEILTINKGWLLVSFILIFGYWFFKAIVLSKIANHYTDNYGFKKAFRLIVEVNFFNAITPFATGGQPYEIYSLKKNNIKFADATNIVIQRFIVYQISIVLLGTIAIIYNKFFPMFPKSNLLKDLITLGFIINFFVIVGLFIITYARRVHHFILNYFIKFLGKIHLIKNVEKTKDRFKSYLDEFHIGANKLLENKLEFVLLILMLLISLCCLYLIPLTLAYGMGHYHDFNSIECILTSAYVMLIGSFVPIPGGTGGLEFGFIEFFSSFLKQPFLNALMLIWRFITYYFGLIVGGIVLNFKRKETK